ncbi:MAG TPA: anhydro-N-acetylmuramic acid kinase [Aggregatilineaceae bacterium]|nr:anhydro-N-acetylmuramic acid kinase [Aggregatilineaceae bacterium]
MLIVGLMSGTSADGIDAALCAIEGEPPAIRATIQHAITYPYPAGFQQHILDACVPERSSVDELCQLNFDLGSLFADAVLQVIEEAGLTPADVDMVGSHGQTVWHMVQSNGRVSATLQITDASVIAERTEITTISNFRPRDVAAGGQGAPLTSYVDWLLLRHPTQWRAVQNIGGIGNVTFLPPQSDSNSGPLAFDTGPGNALIDGAASLITNGWLAYDRDGRLAAQGMVDETWLKSLLEHPYYERKPPKTTGRELFGAAMVAELIEGGRARGLNDSGIMATLTALTAASIVDAYHRFAPASIGETILGGGGARNPTLVSMLRQRLAPTTVLTHEDLGLNSDNKEALVFALLAYETWHARPGNLPALTGAKHPVVLGQITPGKNYVDLIRQTWVQ